MKSTVSFTSEFTVGLQLPGPSQSCISVTYLRRADASVSGSDLPPIKLPVARFMEEIIPADWAEIIETSV